MFNIRILADIRTILEVNIYTLDKIFISLTVEIQLQKSSHLIIDWWNVFCACVMSRFQGCEERMQFFCIDNCNFYNTPSVTTTSEMDSFGTLILDSDF